MAKKKPSRKKSKKVGVSFWKPKKIISKQPKLKVPSYLTSHSRPHKLRKFVANKERLSKMDKSLVIPFLMIGKPKHISKKNLTWPQAKRRFPLLSPYKDADKDGVKNMFDCRPFDKKRQGLAHLRKYENRLEQTRKEERERKLTNKEKRELLREEIEVGELSDEKGFYNINTKRLYKTGEFKEMMEVPGKGKKRAKEHAIEIMMEDEVLKNETALEKVDDDKTLDYEEEQEEEENEEE